ncbi:flavin reductase family protein [Streptomyces sp. 8L]|uniref:flavin reductase family protein n=1 Tax=Streptomyces sp. 8L TaxID=2877242 RepID=UPI001CD5131E|nr:flavin reductase family protein [Streptomyces sp. 8L]MCA1216991.1 flavin reductase family protein [Streptomyces sp. 8L]
MSDHDSAPASGTVARRVSDTAFRRAMAAVATPVSVVTTMEGEIPYGATVSAFASLSMDPPMAMIALDEKSGLLAALRRTHRFALNVLGAGQHDLAGVFARRGGDKFAGVAWHEEAGLPRLAGVSIWVECVVEQFLPGGDHTIAAGLVTDACVGEDLAPLVYHCHQFGTHAPTGAAAHG